MPTHIEIRNIVITPPGGNLVDGETPSGILNGINTNFSIIQPAISGSERVYQNGLRLKRTYDYSISGSAITFTSAPFSGDILLIDYRY